MNKKFTVLFAISAIILLSGVFLAIKYAVGPGEASEKAKNSLVFNVSPAALPSGISPEQITAKPIAAADFSADEIELGASLVFQLGPDGAQFNEPVNFTLVITMPDYATPILFNTTADKIEFVPVLNVNDNGDGTRTITGQLNHFSNLAVVPVATEGDVKSAAQRQDTALNKKENPYGGMDAKELGTETERLDQAEARLKARSLQLQEESKQAGERWKQNFRERAESIGDEGALTWLAANSPEARPVFKTDVNDLDVREEINRILEKKLQIYDALLDIIDAKSSVETPAAQDTVLSLNGVWTSSDAPTVEIRHTRNSVVGIVKEATSTGLSIGDTSFSGTVIGDQFTGEIFVTASNCPNLNRFAAATGTVSGQNELNITTNEAFRFDTKKCEQVAQTTRSVTFTRSQEEPPTTPNQNISLPPVNELPEVEALVEKAPADDDLQLPQDEEALPTVRIGKLDGLAEFQLPDGTWTPIEEGDTLPSAGTLETQYGSTAELHFSDNIIMFVGPLTKFNIKEFKRDPQSYRARLDLGAGEVRFKVLEGDFETDMGVSAPNATASPAGTDFSASYDKNMGLTVYEIYDGSLLVTSTLTGKQETISSKYGEPIKRIEVAALGAMAKQTAIPKDEWQVLRAAEKAPASSTGKKDDGLVWAAVLIFIGSIGISYTAYAQRQILSAFLLRKNQDKS